MARPRCFMVLPGRKLSGWAGILSLLAMAVLGGWTVPEYRLFAGGAPAGDPDEIAARVPVVRLGTWWLLQAQAHPFAAAAEIVSGQPLIVIDADRRQLTLFVDGEPLHVYPCAVGKPSTPSPVGEWKIVSKSYNWGGGFGSRWLGLNVPWGIYGIHGTNKNWSIGRNVSGGCIRMLNRDVEELFRLVQVGTPVKMVGPWPSVRPREVFPARGSGRDVVLFQLKLKETGFSPDWADGRLGPRTERAVCEVQAFYGLAVDGRGTRSVQALIGLLPGVTVP
ncbi:MAG: L,D-transpeptidase family protein [bacterium]|nr:L,D-transpeptidase family protein [bacterium]